MCLASEAGKMETAASQPEDSSSPASVPHTTVKAEIEEDKDTNDSPLSSHASPVLPSISSVTSTSTDANPPQLSSQNARVKKKSKKKEVALSNENDVIACAAKKIIKKCNHTESALDSVFSTIEAVAKGAWKDTEEKPNKKIPSSSAGGENSGSPKKKSKPKVKTPVKEKEEQMEEEHASSDVEMKEEMTDVSPKKETEEEDLQSSTEGPPLQSPSSPPHIKLRDEDKGKERSSETESSAESRGSRKSERSCKGALYKTLVSEGMLTSLRANIDRGIHLNAGLDE